VLGWNDHIRFLPGMLQGGLHRGRLVLPLVNCNCACSKAFPFMSLLIASRTVVPDPSTRTNLRPFCTHAGGRRSCTAGVQDVWHACEPKQAAASNHHVCLDLTTSPQTLQLLHEGCLMKYMKSTLHNAQLMKVGCSVQRMNGLCIPMLVVHA